MFYKQLFFAFSVFYSLQSLSAQTIITDENNICFSVENSLAEAYLKDAGSQYNDSIGRIGTSILNYKTLGKTKAYYLTRVVEHLDCSPNWAEQPKAIPIYTPVNGSVLISRTPNFNNDTISFKSTTDTTKIYNLIPQTAYWYKVFDTKGRVIRNGTFKTQGTLRMISSPKVLNMRDIGGWKCDGGRIAYGKIFRGAAIDGSLTSSTSTIGAVGEEDKYIFTHQLGITQDFDFTGDETVSPLGSTVTKKDYKLSHYVYMLTNTTSSAKTGSYYTEFRSFFIDLTTILKNGGIPYFHCKWGSDRTGTCIALLEALLGVSEKDIVKDWELSSFITTCYFKIIDQSELTYNYKSGTSTVSSIAELREFFQYLYDNYGGSDGATLQEQVTRWLKKNVLKTTSDQAYIATLKSLLVEADVSPTIIKAYDDKNYVACYSITTNVTKGYNTTENICIDENTGKAEENDTFGVTELIDCSQYKYILVNAISQDMFNYYNSNKKRLQGTGLSTLDENTVLYNQGYVQFEIPSGTKYVRFNIPKHSRWEAILSYDSLK